MSASELLGYREITDEPTFLHFDESVTEARLYTRPEELQILLCSESISISVHAKRPFLLPWVPVPAMGSSHIHLI
jgi:hypothetical protein